MARQRFLEIGEVVSTHGVAGEMRVQPWCDSAAAFCRLKVLYGDAQGVERLAVKSRPHQRIVLVKVAGIDSVQQAAAWRGRTLYADREDIPLPAGRYFIQDLLGLSVRDVDNGTVYGTVTAVSNNGAGDIYHMRTPQGGEVLIPAIPDIVISVDVDGGEIGIRPMEGLFSHEI